MPRGLDGRVAYYRSEFTGRMDKIIESNLSVTEKQDIEIHLKRNGKHRSSGRSRGKWDEVKTWYPKIAEKLSAIYQKEWGDKKNPVNIYNFSDTDKLRELCKTIGPEITDDGDGPKLSSIKQPTTKEKINIIKQNINEINDKLGDIEKRLADLEQKYRITR
jgi:hypothetical protein